VTNSLCSKFSSEIKDDSNGKEVVDIGSYKNKFIVAYSYNEIINLANIIRYALITEKATQLLENNQYTFIVNPQFNKNSIKLAIEYLFNVEVLKVNTCHLPKKKRRVGKYIGLKTHYKKAIVTLKEGNVINLFTEN
jgi:large subunit ribosomal protein L23